MGGRQWIGGKSCFFYIPSKNKCIPLMLQSHTHTHTQDLFLQQSVTTRRLDDSAGHSNTAESLGKCVQNREGGKNEDRSISAVQLCDFIPFLTASKLSVDGQNGFCPKYSKSLNSGINSHKRSFCYSAKIRYCNYTVCLHSSVQTLNFEPLLHGGLQPFKT